MIYFKKKKKGKKFIFHKLYKWSILLLLFELNYFFSFLNKYFFKDINKKNKYFSKFYKLKLKYSNKPFLKSFLDNISIISYDYINLVENKNYIHISMSLNNNYIYQMLVSMESALKNCDKNKTRIVYHILCSFDLKKDNLQKLKSLLKKYPSNLEIIFYNMSNSFIHVKNKHHSQAAYYRLLTPLFIPIKKIIHLDCDTLILKDIREMYQIPFNNNYILGNLDVISHAIDYLGIKSNKYINSGVVLINLDKIRKDNKYFDLIKMAEYHQDLRHVDQTVINYVLYPYIGILPFKYGILSFQSKIDIENKYIKLIRQKINVKDILKAFEDPSIIHLVLCVPKPWYKNSKFTSAYTMCRKIHDCSCTKYHNLWHEYAKSTYYYNEILDSLIKK